MAVITGTDGNDVLRGTSGDDVITALGGDDVIYPGTGSDRVDAGDGDDRVVVTLVPFGGNVYTVVDGGSGHNTLDLSQLQQGQAVFINTSNNGAVGFGSLEARNFDHFILSPRADVFTVGDATKDFYLEGGPGDDTLTTGAGNDVLMGGDGNDLLIGGSGSNLIDGGGGIDRVGFAGTGPVYVNLGTGQAIHTGGVDTLVSIENVKGTTGADTLIGDSGANLFDGGGGADSIDGGGGSDTVTFQNYIQEPAHRSGFRYDAPGWTIDLTSQTAQPVNPANGTAGPVHLTSIENVIGTIADDYIVGDAGPNELHGLGGSDQIFGGDGDDILDGGYDSLYYYFDRLYGGNGDDTFLYGGTGGVGGKPGDYMDGGAGSDTLSFAYETNPTTFVLHLGVSQTSNTYISIENVTGSSYNDTLTGDDGDNIIDGGPGGADVLDGGNGTDTVSSATSLAPVAIDLAAQLTWDGSNNDHLSSFENAIGSHFDDLIKGDAGNNVLDGGAGGSDTLIGNGGSDTVSHATSLAAVSIDLQAQLTWDGVTNDHLSSIENAIGSRFDDFIRGDAGNNVLDGGPGGADTLIGNGGSDTVSYATSQSGVVIDLLHQITWDGVASDHLVGIGNAIGSAFDDNIRGDAQANVLDGGAGSDMVSYIDADGAVIIDLGAKLTWDGAVNDQLISIENAQGTRYDDMLIGDAGNNVLDGGPGGSDTLTGNGGSDTVSYVTSSMSVNIDLGTQITWDGINYDHLSSIENAVGSRYDDVIKGDARNNVLDGGVGGADALIGNGGSDTVSYATSQSGVVIDLLHQLTWDGVATDHLDGIGNAIGSAFDDNIRGDAQANVLDGGASGSDMVSYIDADRSVFIDLAAQLTWDGVVNDQLISIENAQGTRYDDVLTGDAGVNTLYGLDGADVLTGGGGADVLIGGNGADRFVYANLSDSLPVAVDHILDFSETDGDRVDLSALDGDTRIDGHQSVHFVNAFSAYGGSAEAILSYDPSANTTTLSLDANGDSVPDFQLLFTGQIHATADFIL